MQCPTFQGLGIDSTGISGLHRRQCVLASFLNTWIGETHCFCWRESSFDVGVVHYVVQGGPKKERKKAKDKNKRQIVQSKSFRCMDLYLYADHSMLNACLCIPAVNIVPATFWIALEIKQIA